MPGITWNPFTDNLDFIGNVGAITIPEYTSDPVSPATNAAWVLRSGGFVGGGSPIGLLLALTQAGGGSFTYQLSYQTTEGTIVRTTLS